VLSGKNPKRDRKFNEPVSLVRGEVFSSRFPDMVINFTKPHYLDKRFKAEAKILRFTLKSRIRRENWHQVDLASNNQK